MIDISDMFPNYDRAEAMVKDGIVHVRLYAKGQAFSAIELKLDRIANCLEKLRRSSSRED